MKNLKIIQKIMVFLVIISAALLLVADTGRKSIVKVSDEFQTFYNQNYMDIDTLGNMKDNLERSSKFLVLFCGMERLGVQALDDETLQNYEKYAKGLEENLQAWEKSTDGNVQQVKDIREAKNALDPVANQIVALLKAGEFNNAYLLYLSQYHDLSNAMQEKIQVLDEFANEYAVNTITTSKKQANQAIVTNGVVGIAGIIIAWIIGIYVAMHMSRPIGEMEKAAKKISQGDFDVDLSYTAKDEIGHLYESMRVLTDTTSHVLQDTDRLLHSVAQGDFNISTDVHYPGVYEGIMNSIYLTCDELSNTLRTIMNTSNQVATGAEQVSNGAQALSQGSTEQAASVEELSATIADISDKIKNTASSAEEARKMSNEAGQEVSNSNNDMQELMKAMDNITETSNEINKIIKTIEDIAFQTNILALNAAVEAARAGQAGKGFAVVADEVRNLAGKSAEAAKNTTALIENAIAAINDGTSIASRTAGELVNVVCKVQLVDERIQEIATYSEQQAIAIEQIDVGITQISNVVQNNSATAEESAAASEELSGQAINLQHLISKFQLKQ